MGDPRTASGPAVYCPICCAAGSDRSASVSPDQHFLVKDNHTHWHGCLQRDQRLGRMIWNSTFEAPSANKLDYSNPFLIAPQLEDFALVGSSI